MKGLKTKTIVLLGIGLLIIMIPQIITRFLELSDFINGSLVGSGIGLILIALMYRSSRKIKIEKKIK